MTEALPPRVLLREWRASGSWWERERANVWTETPSIKRMKAVERWGNNRFVRMVTSMKRRRSVKPVRMRSQLIFRVVS